MRFRWFRIRPLAPFPPHSVLWYVASRGGCGPSYKAPQSTKAADVAGQRSADSLWEAPGVPVELTQNLTGQRNLKKGREGVWSHFTLRERKGLLICPPPTPPAFDLLVLPPFFFFFLKDGRLRIFLWPWKLEVCLKLWRDHLIWPHSENTQV